MRHWDRENGHISGLGEWEQVDELGQWDGVVGERQWAPQWAGH